MSDDSNMGRQFPVTRWSVIEGSRSADAEERQRALDVLVSAYWKPVYKYIRQHHYFEIMLPGGIVGTIIGYATQRFGRAQVTAP